MSTEEEIKKLVCDLCRQFYELGWVTGTGGSISIRDEERIYMTPSGVQKERIKPDELFVVNKAGEILHTPGSKVGFCPKLSDCAPLFLHAYNQRNAGAVLHSHGPYCNLVTMLFHGRSEFRICKQEMIKGIEGHGYYDELVVPIIENTAWEHELADSLGEAIAKYPKACAVLVRQHGMYVWGKSWEQAKRHGECLHYLFEIYVKTHELGLTHMITKYPQPPKFKHLVLDIEGTISPITFVKDVLFPYSVQKVRSYLAQHWDEPFIQRVVGDLSVVAASELVNGAPEFANTQEAVAQFVEWLVSKDRKVGPLKTLQGLIWKEGYQSNEITSIVFEDVRPALERFVFHGVKVHIYSSGSRQAQHLLCQYSNQGDLRNLITAYFDTSVGMKQEVDSYYNICLTLGCDPQEVLFATDVLGEANAAAAAGLDVTLSIRDGNVPITQAHNFRTITSFEEL